jgi:hypothetical protein
MYRAFRLREFNFKDVFLHAGKAHFNTHKVIVEDALKRYTANGRIDGSALRDSWFPEIDADVFISHSHQNRDFALALSGWLFQRFRIRSFVDSLVWGFSDTLLRGIDDVYSWDKERNVFDYCTRNRTTSHVHMMLATALTRMIDRCECVVFLDTPNSVFISDASENVVKSPWIYFELDQISKLKTKEPDRTELLKEARDIHFSRKGGDFEIEYRPDFASLTGIDYNTLKDWNSEWNESTTMYPSPLDALYNLAPHRYERK